MSGVQRVALVPGTPALLPVYASIVDPIPGLRAAVRSALSWLVELGVPITVHCEHRAQRIAEHLVSEAGGRLDQGDGPRPPAAVLVLGNGSARRTEKAPGYFDPRAADFDNAVGSALRSPDPGALLALDRELGAELLADLDAIVLLGSILTEQYRTVMTYDDDPYGVQYWVAQWEWTPSELAQRGSADG